MGMIDDMAKKTDEEIDKMKAKTEQKIHDQKVAQDVQAQQEQQQ